MRAGFALAAVVLVGCGKPPVEAPAEIKNLAEFLFQHGNDKDTTELEVGVANLRTALADEDFSLNARDRAVTLGILDGEQLGGLSIPDGAKASEEVPIGLARQSTQSFDDNVQLALEPNRVCIESDTTKYAIRTFTEGQDCFPDTCNVLRYEQPTRKENALAKIWYDQKGVYQLLDVEPDEGEPFRALVHRYWIEERGISANGNNTWETLFGIDVTYEDGTNVRGWTGLWSWIDIPVIGPDSYANLVIDAIEQGGIFADEFIAGVTDGECGEDRDAEKPDRP